LGNAAKIGFLHKLLSAPLARFQTSGRYCTCFHERQLVECELEWIYYSIRAVLNTTYYILFTI
jgi:hypothetical protein